jgi:Flp pilus assembly protein TadG
MRRGRRGSPTPSTPATGSASPAARDRGAAAVEFALVAPLLFTLLFLIIGAGWGLWEYQASRSTAREAARLASLGIYKDTTYEHEVACLGERNGIQAGALSKIDLKFFHPNDYTGVMEPNTSAAVPSNYVQVTLTYISTLRGLPFVTWAFADGAGHFDTTATTRIEQVPRVDQAPSRIASSQTLNVSGQSCP